MASDFQSNERKKGDQFYHKCSVQKWRKECKMENMKSREISCQIFSMVFSKENNDQMQLAKSEWKLPPMGSDYMRQIITKYIDYFLDQRKALNSYVALGIFLNLSEHQGFFILFYWNIVGLQCCAIFSCTAKRFSFIYTYIYIFFKILFSYRLSHNTEQSSLYYTEGPCWLPYI